MKNLVVQPGKLFPGALLDEIPGEQNRVPWARVVMRDCQIVEKGLLDIGPERPLAALPKKCRSVRWSHLKRLIVCPVRSQVVRGKVQDAGSQSSPSGYVFNDLAPIGHSHFVARIDCSDMSDDC